MGCIPTKTSVELRGPEGSIGSIPAASEASAGVMTAEHVKMLQAIYTWHQTEKSSGVVEIITPARVAPETTAQVAAVRAGIAQISNRVAQLETALSSADRVEHLALPAPDIAGRIDQAEDQIRTLATALHEIVALVDDANQRLAFIEGHALASVHVETKQGEAA